MRELADSTVLCRQSSLKVQVVVAFILEKAFKDWADSMDGRPVEMAEAEQLRNRVVAPVQRAIDFLCAAGAADPIEVCSALARVAL
jgi:hypothetical protein